MATLDLILTYADQQAPRILKALKANAATQANPTPTNADAIEWFRVRVINDLRTLVRDYDKQATLDAAEQLKASAAAVIVPDIS